MLREKKKFYVSWCVSGIMFNTGIGQHILKNPLIVNAIIEKVSNVDCDFFWQICHLPFKESDS